MSDGARISERIFLCLLFLPFFLFEMYWALRLSQQQREAAQRRKKRIATKKQQQVQADTL